MGINKLTVTQQEFEILELLKDKIQCSYHYEDTNGLISIEIDDDNAEALSEAVKEKLQLEGFDANYNHNAVGRVCESLIDKFYAVGW